MTGPKPHSKSLLEQVLGPLFLKPHHTIPENKKCPRHKKETILRNPQYFLESGTGFTDKDLLEVSGLRQSPSVTLGSKEAVSITPLDLQRRPQLQTLAEVVCVLRIFSPIVTLPGIAQLCLRCQLNVWEGLCELPRSSNHGVSWVQLFSVTALTIVL